MRQIDFYIIDPPIIDRKNGNHKQPIGKSNETYFLHGNGCRDHANCLTCPKPECNWLPYPKPKRDRKEKQE